jgi:hypothetical protein
MIATDGAIYVAAHHDTYVFGDNTDSNYGNGM